MFESDDEEEMDSGSIVKQTADITEKVNLFANKNNENKPKFSMFDEEPKKAEEKPKLSFFDEQDDEPKKLKIILIPILM